MVPDIVDARYLENYKIELVFENGERGVVDFSGYLDAGGVFGRFRDMNFFRRYRLDRELGTLVWDDEVDIAPETLYSRATGKPLPGWTGKVACWEGEGG